MISTVDVMVSRHYDEGLTIILGPIYNAFHRIVFYYRSKDCNPCILLSYLHYKDFSQDYHWNSHLHSSRYPRHLDCFNIYLPANQLHLESRYRRQMFRFQSFYLHRQPSPYVAECMDFLTSYSNHCSAESHAISESGSG